MYCVSIADSHEHTAEVVPARRGCTSIADRYEHTAEVTRVTIHPVFLALKILCRRRAIMSSRK